MFPCAGNLISAFFKLRHRSHRIDTAVYDPRGVEVFQANSRLCQLSNIRLGQAALKDSRGGYTHQLQSVGSSMLVQVLCDVPIPHPRSYDREADPPSKTGVRNFENGI